MLKIYNIVSYFEETVPNAMKMDFDNVGFLVGNSENSVSRVLVALDITDDVIDEAIRICAELIVSHHPMFFSLKSVTDQTAEGSKIVKLLSNNISAICLHTNLDSVVGGVNDELITMLGASSDGILEHSQSLEDGREYGCGRYGMLECEVAMPEFLAHVKTVLATNGLRYHDAGRPVHKLAVCGGSGGSMLADALRNGCDTYVTADVKYDQFLTAKEVGLNLIDADHFCTENVVVPVLVEMLKADFPELIVETAKTHGQCAQFY